MPDKELELNDQVKRNLLYLLEKVEREDVFVRYSIVKACKKAEEFWHGVQYLFWSDYAQDWQRPESQNLQSEQSRDSAGPFYDYVVNIYKAHGEAIIAALSQETPTVEFFPDDADESDDISTATTKTNIGLLIQKQNKVKLLLINALFKMYNQGPIFAYNYHKADAAFGTTKIDKFGDVDVPFQAKVCHVCAAPLGEVSQSSQDNESAESIPDNEMQEMQNPAMQPSQDMNNPEMPMQGMEQCPTCGYEGAPDIIPQTRKETQKIGDTEVPKSRECIDVYAALNVKVPFYARKQSEFGYLLLYLEESFAKMRADYPDLRDKIGPQFSTQANERWARIPTLSSTGYQAADDYTTLTTVKRLWLRPFQFEILDQKEDVDKLKKDYPNGCKVVVVGNEVAEVIAENLDDVWTYTPCGPASNVNSDPLGAGAIPLQEMKNALVNLTIQTIEHGIPSTFADPEVLNFDEYNKTEATPGYVFPIKPKPGKGIGESFFELRTANLAKEVPGFSTEIDRMTEFILGDPASIYGGPATGNTRTLGEYAQSRAQALQRLTIAWEYIRLWWAEVIDKSVTSFIKNMIEDSHFVVKEGNLFKNIMIHKENLLGKANVSPEASEHFPMSQLQKQNLLMQFFQMNNESILAILGHPENAHIIKDTIGFPELYIPGDDQRFKQLVEIKELLKTEPLVDEQGVQPSVMIEPEIDDDEIHLETIKVFLASSRGQDEKKINPNGYRNCMAHAEMHQMNIDEKAAQQSMQQAPMENQNAQLQ